MRYKALDAIALANADATVEHLREGKRMLGSLTGDARREMNGPTCAQTAQRSQCLPGRRSCGCLES